MSHKEFVIGLIEKESERDLSQRTDVSGATTDAKEVAEEHTEQQEEAAASDCESVSAEVGAKDVEQENNDFSEDFDSGNEIEYLDEQTKIHVA